MPITLQNKMKAMIHQMGHIRPLRATIEDGGDKLEITGKNREDLVCKILIEGFLRGHNYITVFG